MNMTKKPLQQTLTTATASIDQWPAWKQALVSTRSGSQSPQAAQSMPSTSLQAANKK